MSSAFQVDGLLIKISKKNAVLLMKMPSLLMTEKIETKILLMDKAVVTLLIRSFRGGQQSHTTLCPLLLYNCGKVLQSLIRLKNSLIAQGRYTDAVDDILARCFQPRKESSKSNI